MVVNMLSRVVASANFLGCYFGIFSEFEVLSHIFWSVFLKFKKACGVLLTLRFNVTKVVKLFLEFFLNKLAEFW